MRTTRGATPVLYEPSESFEIGGSLTVRDGGDITLIGAGITLHESLAAAEELAGNGIEARVIDLYSVKPVDRDAILAAAAETGAILTVEDHWPEGGIGETVAGVLAEAGAGVPLVRLAVTGRPTSGSPEELLAAAGIDAASIVAAAKQTLSATQKG
jgi:transketolase